MVGPFLLALWRRSVEGHDRAARDAWNFVRATGSQAREAVQDVDVSSMSPPAACGFDHPRRPAAGRSGHTGLVVQLGQRAATGIAIVTMPPGTTESSPIFVTFHCCNVTSL